MSAEPNPSIQTHSCISSLLSNLLMQVGRNPNIKPPRKRLFRLFANFFAQQQIIFHRISQSLFQFINGTSLECNHIIEMQDFPVKNVGILVVFKFALIAFIGHSVHGFSPIFAKYRLMDFTAPLSVVGCGCGRWNTATCLSQINQTRDPRPSLIVPPYAWKTPSISAHAMAALTGSANMTSKVLRCLLFMAYGTTNKCHVKRGDFYSFYSNVI